MSQLSISNPKIAVFWVIVLCSLQKFPDIPEVLAVPIIKE
jgi:hypothetical protein